MPEAGLSAPLAAAWWGPQGGFGQGLTQRQEPLLTRAEEVTNRGSTEPREGKPQLLGAAWDGALLVLGTSRGPCPVLHRAPCSEVC